MSEEFGNGIFLDGGFDFSIDPTGDIRASRGSDELQKDLAVQMVLNLQRFVGQPPSGNSEASVASIVKDVANADSRISSVVQGSIDVTFSNDRRDINIKMNARTSSGEQELVFEV